MIPPYSREKCDKARYCRRDTQYQYQTLASFHENIKYFERAQFELLLNGGTSPHRMLKTGGIASLSFAVLIITIVCGRPAGGGSHPPRLRRRRDRHKPTERTAHPTPRAEGTNRYTRGEDHEYYYCLHTCGINIFLDAISASVTPLIGASFLLSSEPSFPGRR